MYTWLLVAVGHHLAHSQPIGHQFIMRTQQNYLHNDFTTYMFLTSLQSLNVKYIIQFMLFYITLVFFQLLGLQYKATGII